MYYTRDAFPISLYIISAELKLSKMAWMAHSYVHSARPFIRGLTWHRLASTDQAQSVKPFSDIPGEYIISGTG